MHDEIRNLPLYAEANRYRVQYRAPVAALECVQSGDPVKVSVDSGSYTSDTHAVGLKSGAGEPEGNLQLALDIMLSVKKTFR